MSAKHFWPLVMAGTLLAGTGCCRLCDRWCGDNHYNAGAAQPCCAPTGPVPACCTPGPAAVGPPPAATWQRQYPNACCQ